MNTAKARELLKEFEGFKSKPYLCKRGIATIGYGTTIYPNGRKVTLFDPPVTEKQAAEMLDIGINQVKQDILKILPVELTENQLNSLISFVYNVGIGQFKRSTLFKVIKLNHKSGRVGEEMRKWNKITVNGVKKVSSWQVRRRKIESELYYKTE